MVNGNSFYFILEYVRPKFASLPKYGISSNANKEQFRPLKKWIIFEWNSFYQATLGTSLNGLVSNGNKFEQYKQNEIYLSINSIRILSGYSLIIDTAQGNTLFYGSDCELQCSLINAIFSRHFELVVDKKKYWIIHCDSKIHN